MNDAGPDDETSPNPSTQADGVKLHLVPPSIEPQTSEPAKERGNAGLVDWLKTMVKGKADSTLRETLEDYIEDAETSGKLPSLNAHERALIANILKLRDLTVFDMMIPRADISAIDVTISQGDLLSLLAEKQYSRLPVYRDSLDDVLGTIHIKDILLTLAKGEAIHVPSLIRDVPIVAPSMPVPDLLLMMKQKKRHMALVVDEYGGIDGMATIGDIIESIVGEVEDEYDQDSTSDLLRDADGNVSADGRVDIETFEQEFGKILDEDEREDIDTLGGLVYALAGRIPARGEIITHPSGMIFEVLDADLRRVKRILIRNIPTVSE